MPFPVDRSFVTAAEERLGVAFPADFVERMTLSNGGEVQTRGSYVWQLHPIRDSSDRKMIARTASDIVHETLLARKWTSFPDDAVNIGEDGGGNHLVLLPSGSDPGRLGPELYDWDHETGELTKVAESFSAAKFPEPAVRRAQRVDAKLTHLDTRGVVIDVVPSPWQLFEVGRVRPRPNSKASKWKYFYSNSNFDFRHGKKGAAKAILTKPFTRDDWDSLDWWTEQIDDLLDLGVLSPGYPPIVEPGSLGGAETVTFRADGLLPCGVAVRPAPDAEWGMVLVTEITRLTSDLIDLQRLIDAIAADENG